MLKNSDIVKVLLRQNELKYKHSSYKSPNLKLVLKFQVSPNHQNYFPVPTIGVSPPPPPTLEGAEVYGLL